MTDQRPIEDYTESNDTGHNPFPKGGWYVVAVLSFAYMISYMDRQILTLLVDPIREDLNISDTQISILTGFAFAFLYTIVGLPIGRLVDFRSRRMIIMIGALIWSVMTALCGLSRNFWQLFLARTGVGIGEATLSPSAYSLIADYFPPDKLARAMSVYVMSIFLGAGFAMMIGATIIDLVPKGVQVSLPLVGMLSQWQLAFVLVALPGFLVAALMFTFSEPPRRNVSKKLGKSTTAVPIRTVISYAISRKNVYLPYIAGYTLFNIMANGIMMWVPTFFVRIHAWDASQVGYSFGVLLLVFGVVGALVGGLITDVLRKKHIVDAPILVSMTSVALVVPFVIAMCLVTNDKWSMAMVAPIIFFLSIPGVLAPTVLQLITPNQLRGQFSAFFLFFTTLFGLGLGPTLVALFTDYVFFDDMSLKYSILTVSIFSGVMTIGILRLGLEAFREALRTRDA